MKLVIIHEPMREAYTVYEVEQDGGRTRVTSFKAESEARAYCENRKKSRVIAEYELDG